MIKIASFRAELDQARQVAGKTLSKSSAFGQNLTKLVNLRAKLAQHRQFVVIIKTINLWSTLDQHRQFVGET